MSTKKPKSASSEKASKKKGSKSSAVSSKPPISAPLLDLQAQPVVDPQNIPKLPFSKDYYHEVELTGIFPMFLTSQSQAIAKSKIEVDVTSDKMFNLVPKQVLVNDMASRLAISDFTPAKALIMAYPRDEMILHYDPEYRYTQNFFLVVDVATADMILTVSSLFNRSRLKLPLNLKKPMESIQLRKTKLGCR